MSLDSAPHPSHAWWRRSRLAREQHLTSYFECDYPNIPLSVGDEIAVEGGHGPIFRVTRIAPGVLPGIINVYGRPS